MAGATVGGERPPTTEQINQQPRQFEKAKGKEGNYTQQRKRISHSKLCAKARKKVSQRKETDSYNKYHLLNTNSVTGLQNILKALITSLREVIVTPILQVVKNNSEVPSVAQGNSWQDKKM